MINSIEYCGHILEMHLDAGNWEAIPNSADHRTVSLIYRIKCYNVALSRQNNDLAKFKSLNLRINHCFSAKQMVPVPITPATIFNNSSPAVYSAKGNGRHYNLNRLQIHVYTGCMFPTHLTFYKWNELFVTTTASLVVVRTTMLQQSRKHPYGSSTMLNPPHSGHAISNGSSHPAVLFRHSAQLHNVTTLQLSR